MCESFIVYILPSTCQWVHMALTVNRPDVRIFINILYIGAHIGIQKWWETFTKLLVSSLYMLYNIINHGESEVQWQISI